MSNDRLRSALLTSGPDRGGLGEPDRGGPQDGRPMALQGRIPHRTNRRRVADVLGQDDAYLWPDALADSDSSGQRRGGRRDLPKPRNHPHHVWTSLLSRPASRSTSRVRLELPARHHPGLWWRPSRTGPGRGAGPGRLRGPRLARRCAARRGGGHRGLAGRPVPADVEVPARPARGVPGVTARMHDSRCTRRSSGSTTSCWPTTTCIGAPAGPHPCSSLRRPEAAAVPALHGGLRARLGARPNAANGRVSPRVGGMARIDYIDDPNAPRANSVVPSVIAIVEDDRGRVLLIHKTDNNLWALPGGGHDIGESIADTVVREVREETGYDVEVRPHRHLHQPPPRHGLRRRRGAATVLVAFRAHSSAGRPGPAPRARSSGSTRRDRPADAPLDAAADPARPRASRNPIPRVTQRRSPPAQTTATKMGGDLTTAR